ncbi:39S ribosomal protein L45, mitochondrial [Heracleum sosnowskyi]|uniref:Large ribosomal subunit protein mL45 n=1 Tax=Heracleum sosnowskyi TaxID=360622 RepID=A0AAD8HWR7_9APIA|nr:39S ribosomal protein L45, mitochondrial [Heracleum sosnowskyi]
MLSRVGRIRNVVGRMRNVCVGGGGYEITNTLLGGSRNYHYVAGIDSSMLKSSCARLWTSGDSNVFRSTVVVQQPIFWNQQRMVTTQTKVPAQARHKGTQLSMQSPGFVIEPFTRREPIAFWRRCFTRSGWRRTKEDLIVELKSAYAISKLRKKGYSKQKFYTEAFNLYKQINSQIATRDKASLRKAVTENMYSTLKNEIKQRQSVWSSVYLELIEPAVKIRTLRARMIALDKDDLSKFFIQLTLEFLTKQKFEAYDSSGAIVAGNKDKEVLVRDIWVFEKSFFHQNSYWRLCGRIKV